MNTKYDCQMALDHLYAELDLRPQDETLIAELIEIYPTCSDDLRSAYNMWIDLQELEVPLPSERMDASFYKALNEYSVEKSVPLQMHWLKYAAAGLVLVLSGIFMGRQLGDEKAPVQLVVTEQVPDAMQVNVARMTMSRSSTHKMEAIHDTKEIDNPSDKIFEALNQVLLKDQSINVRLSAIEAMLHFSDDPLARSYLIKAIPFQDSPIVQIALADAMINLEERESLGTMKEMLESGDLELEVKDHFEDAIKILM